MAVVKRIVVAFQRRIYSSDPDGNVQKMLLAQELIPTVGQSLSMEWEVTIWARSSSNARGDLYLYQGTKTDPRASQPFGGAQLGSTQTYSTIGVTNYQQNAPYHGLIDAVFGVRSQTPTVGVQEWLDAEVRVTLTLM